MAKVGANKYLKVIQTRKPIFPVASRMASDRVDHLLIWLKMPGKQAKILSADHIDDLLFFVETTRHPLRNRVLVLLSVKAGLRAAEIAKLTWDMVVDGGGN